MPNWCTNNVTLSGERVPELLKDLQAPLRLIKQEPGNWEIVESADGEEQKPYSYFFYRLKHVLPNEWVPGYMSNIEHIGSKWGVCDPTVTPEEDNHVHIHFSSAWGPCVRGFLRIAKHYKLDMEYDYEECGNDISGDIGYSAENNIVQHWRGSYAVGRIREDAPSWEQNAERLKDAISEFFTIELDSWDSSDVIGTKEALRKALEEKEECPQVQEFYLKQWEELGKITLEDVRRKSCTFEEAFGVF